MDRSHIEAELDDSTNNLLRLLADISLDEGDEALAAGYRWLAKWNKYPLCEIEKETLMWWWVSGYENNHGIHCYRIPCELEPVYYATKPLAFRKAAEAMGKWLADGQSGKYQEETGNTS